jgi:hypothetical protein
MVQHSFWNYRDFTLHSIFKCKQIYSRIEKSTRLGNVLQNVKDDIQRHYCK